MTKTITLSQAGSLAAAMAMAEPGDTILMDVQGATGAGATPQDDKAMEVEEANAEFARGATPGEGEPTDNPFALFLTWCSRTGRMDVTEAMYRWADAFAALGGRAAPTNCQQEPGYPGAPTVVCSLRAPDIVCHSPTARCAVQEPHGWDDCGEVRGRAAGPAFRECVIIRRKGEAGNDPFVRYIVVPAEDFPSAGTPFDEAMRKLDEANRLMEEAARLLKAAMEGL